MKNWKLWLAATALLTPIFMLYAGHYMEFLTDKNLVPTGFLGKRDAPYYMALAREYFDQKNFGLFYPLPMSDNFDNQPIYFQIHILAFALIWKFTGIDPGTLFVVFGFAAGIVCIWILLRLWSERFGFDSFSKKLTFELWIWGGGVLSIVGFALAFFKFGSLKSAILEMFFLDPDRGWWGLNFGRNLIYPTEAFYHALAAGITWFVFKKRYGWAAFLTLVLAFSSPHMGSTFIGIMLVWTVFERFFMKNREVSSGLLLSIAGILALHIGYYLVFLNQNAEHREMIETHWVETENTSGTNFIYHARNFIPGYFLVAAMCFLYFRRRETFKTAFADPFNRFLIAMFCVVIGLSNHDLLFKPHQPLHFEKGFVYFSLFLLAAPFLIELFQKLASQGRKLAIFGIALLFFFDNLTFFPYFTFDNFRGGGLKMTRSQHEVLKFLDDEKWQDRLLVADEEMIAYWAMVYTPMRSLVSHEVTTPNIEAKREWSRQLFQEGKLAPELANRKLLILDNRKRANSANLCDSIPCQTVFVNPVYNLFTVN